MRGLYLISQSANNDYDVFDSAVVCADSEEMARCIHPDGQTYPDGNWDEHGDWTKPENVTVELIGFANEKVKSGDVICSSFNAG